MLAPTVASTSEPDYVNQTLALLLPAAAISQAALLDAIRTSVSRGEVAYLLETVEASSAAILDGPAVSGDAIAAARRAATLDRLAAASVRPDLFDG